MSRIRLAWGLLAALLASGVAHAQEATVDALFVRDGAAWRPVLTTGEALRVAPAREALRVGMALQPGDVLRTEDVRVRLRIRGDEQLIVAEHSEVELQPRSVWQRLGDALYRVHGVFRVRFGAVEAAVEGTRFAVLPAGGVAVQRGRVRVGDAVGTAGTWVAVVDGAVAAPVAVPEAPADRARSLARHLGPPRSAVGGEVGGGVFDGAGAGAVRVLGRFAFSPLGEVYAEGGVAFTADRLHVPLAAGLALRWGWLRVGLGGAVRLGPCEVCEGDPPVEDFVFRPGGQAQVGLTVPLDGRLNLVVTGRAEVYAEAVSVDGAAGLIVGF